MKVFVTGANGFVGRAFCRAAKDRGYEVLGLCREAKGVNLGDGCEPVQGSLAKPPWTEIEKFGPDIALHLAWITAPATYLTSPVNDELVNQSVDLFDGLIERGLSRVACIGTCIEYAASNGLLDESLSSLNPTFPYARAKTRLFNWLNDKGRQSGLSWTWFRLFYPYGVGERRDRLTSYLVRELERGNIVQLKTPLSTKDYIYVSDVAEALCYGLQGGLTGAVNVGSGQGLSILELAQMVARLVGASPTLIRNADLLSVDPTPFRVADISKLRATGWVPRTTLADGLERLIASISESSSESLCSEGSERR